MKISVVGLGYVGLSISVLISQKYEVLALDIDEKKMDLVNNKKSPFKDSYIEEFLRNKKLDLTVSRDKELVFKNSDYLVIATPTNYSIETGSFNTESVESVIKDYLEINKKGTIVIKSTIPLNFTNKMRKKYSDTKIFFSPEFLRESNALYDNLYPSRIIVGDYTDEAKKFANILLSCSHENDENKILFMSSSEAEAVKLFSNTYLAMRVSFFNELDSFSYVNNLLTENVIKGVCLDSRIGNYYNNPSFGYGGYCLPKDTKQLLENFKNVPNNIIEAVVNSNETRKAFVIKSILEKRPKSIGVYRLTMKYESDNFRESAVGDIILELKKHDIKLYLYEPYIKDEYFEDIKIIENFSEFVQKSDLIVANRISKNLENFRHKLFTRDLFQEN